MNLNLLNVHVNIEVTSFESFHQDCLTFVSGLHYFRLFVCVAVILIVPVRRDTTSPQHATCVGPTVLDMTGHGASAKNACHTGDTSEPQASKRDGERQGEEDGATADASSSLQHTDANRDDSAMRC